MSGQSSAQNHLYSADSSGSTGTAYTVTSSSLGPIVSDLPSVIPHREIQALASSIYSISHLPKMVDPVSLLASIIAISEAGIKISKSLYKFSSAFCGSLQEIDALASEIEAFSIVLEELHDWLEGNQSQISTRALSSANKILRSCKIIFADVKQMIGKGDGVNSVTFWHRVRWSFRREKIMPMKSNLESFKTTLTLLLFTMQLAKHKAAHTMDGSEKAVDRKEKKLATRVERGIRSQSDALNRWQQAEQAVQAELSIQYVPKYLTWTPSHNSSWLKQLMPTVEYLDTLGKPYLALPGIPNTPNSPNNEEKVITKTIDVLLSSWTNIEGKQPSQGDDTASGSGDLKPSQFESPRVTIEIRDSKLGLAQRNSTTKDAEDPKKSEAPISHLRGAIVEPTRRRPTVVIEEGSGDETTTKQSVNEHHVQLDADVELLDPPLGMSPHHHTSPDSGFGNLETGETTTIPESKVVHDFVNSSRRSTRNSHTHIDITHVRSRSPSVGDSTESDEEAAITPVEISPQYSIIQPPQSVSGSSSHPGDFVHLLFPHGETLSTSDNPESASRSTSERRKPVHRQRNHQYTDSRDREAQDPSPTESGDSTEEFMSRIDWRQNMPRPQSYYGPNGYTQSSSSGSYAYPPVPHPGQIIPLPMAMPYPPHNGATPYPPHNGATPYPPHNGGLQDPRPSQFSYPYGSLPQHMPTLGTQGAPASGYFPGQYPPHYGQQFPSQMPYPYGGYGAQPPVPPPSEPSATSTGSDTETEPPKTRSSRKRKRRQTRTPSHTASRNSDKPPMDRSTGNVNTSQTESLGERSVLYYVNAIGEKFEFPFSRCQLWKDMELLARKAHHPGDGLSDRFSTEGYHILDPDGNIILPTLWEDSVEPGWTVTLIPKTFTPGSKASTNTDQGMSEDADRVQPEVEIPEMKRKNLESRRDIKNEHQYDEDNMNDILRAETPPPAVNDSKSRHSRRARAVSCEEASEYEAGGPYGYEDSAESTTNNTDHLTEDLFGIIGRSRLWGEDVKNRLRKAVESESALAQVRLRRRHAKIMFDESVVEYKNHGLHDSDIFIVPMDTDGADSTFSESQTVNTTEVPRGSQSTLENGRSLPQLPAPAPSASSASYQIRTSHSSPSTASKSTSDLWDDAVERHGMDLSRERREDRHLSALNRPKASAAAQAQPQTLQPTITSHDPTENAGPTKTEIPLEQKIDFLTSLVERLGLERRAKDAEIKQAADERRLRQLEETLLNIQQPLLPHSPYPLQLAPFQTGFANTVLPHTPPVTPSTSKSNLDVQPTSPIGNVNGSSQSSFKRGLKQRFWSSP